MLSRSVAFPDAETSCEQTQLFKSNTRQTLQALGVSLLLASQNQFTQTPLNYGPLKYNPIKD